MPNSMIINLEFAKSLAPGWEERILAHGSVLTRGGTHLLDVEGIHKTLSEEGEIEFRCHTGETTAEFINKSEC